MSLTGHALQWGTIAVALLAAAAVVVLWARLARPGLLGVLLRISALMGVNVLLVFALLVTANRHYVFYSGWDDLLGVQPQVSEQFAGAQPQDRSSAAVSAVEAGTLHPTAPEGTTVSGYGGRVQQLQVTGASGVTGRVLVVLPRGYGDASNAGRTYPVLVALHGFPGTPEQWLTALDVRAALDSAAGSHQVLEPIVVVPDLAQPAGRDTECLNGPAGQPQVETWLSSDLPKAVEASYRARTSAAAWATMGFSMGGWCSAVLTMLHPQQFGAGIVMGGYFEYEPSSSYSPLTPGSAEAKAHDLVSIAASNPPAVSLFVSSSQDDPESWPTTKTFLAAAKAPLSATALIAKTGGHRSDVWAAQMPKALAWLGQTAAGFSPKTGSAQPAAQTSSPAAANQPAASAPSTATASKAAASRAASAAATSAG